MSIVRHEIRQISDDNRGQPIISQAVVHGNVAYFAGVTPDPIAGDIKTQTAQVLRRVDELLKLAGTDTGAPATTAITCLDAVKEIERQGYRDEGLHLLAERLKGANERADA